MQKIKSSSFIFFFFTCIIIEAFCRNTVHPPLCVVTNSASSIDRKCFKKQSIFVTLEILFISKLASIFGKTTDALIPVLQMQCCIFASISLTLVKDFACVIEKLSCHWFLCFSSSLSIPPGKYLALLDVSKWCVPNHLDL